MILYYFLSYNHVNAALVIIRDRSGLLLTQSYCIILSVYVMVFKYFLVHLNSSRPHTMYCYILTYFTKQLF